MTQGRIFSKLLEARGQGTFSKRLAHFINVDLRVIDDFGLRPLEGKQDEDFHEIISERYELRPTIVTSNLEFYEGTLAFPNRLLRAATLDRLRHEAYNVTSDGESYRGSRLRDVDGDLTSRPKGNK